MLWSVWREFPVRPRQRAVTVRPAKSTVASVALGLAGLALSPPEVAAVEQVAPPDPAEIMASYEAPLNDLIARLAAQQEVAATEFADLAEETLTWGNQMLQTGQQPQPSVVLDALAGVDVGEVMDEWAADWPSLREALEKLLEQSQPPPQDDQEDQSEDGDSSDESQPDSSDSPSDGESGEGESDQDQSGEKGESEDQNQDGQPGEDGQQGEDGKPSEEDGAQDSEGESSDEQDSEGEGSEPQPQEQPSEQARENAQNAFDDMDPSEPESGESPQPEPAESPNEPAAGNQSIGGQQVQDQEARDNPELVIPLQKLDQLKDQDSPAQLYQLMQDPNAQPPKSGRDW